MPKKRPFGITILSVIGFISAFIMLSFGAILLIVGAGAANIPYDGTGMSIIGTLGAAAGIIVLVGGLIQGIISFGLWKMQKWAWYAAIGTYALSIIASLTQMEFVPAVIGGLMVYYLYSVQKKF